MQEFFSFALKEIRSLDRDIIENNTIFEGKVSMKNDFFSRKLALILSVTLLMTTLFVGMPSKAVDLQNDDNLIAYYSFDDVNGTTVPDKSGNGHNGTIKGAASVTLGKRGTAINFDKAGHKRLMAKFAKLEKI